DVAYPGDGVTDLCPVVEAGAPNQHHRHPGGVQSLLEDPGLEVGAVQDGVLAGFADGANPTCHPVGFGPVVGGNMDHKRFAFAPVGPEVGAPLTTVLGDDRPGGPQDHS